MNPSRNAILVLLGLGALGCEPRGEPADRPARAGTAPPAATAAAAAPTTIALQVSWPARAAIDQKARAALEADARAAVDRSPVPVMVPADRAMLGRTRVFAREQWVAVSSSFDGLSLSIHGRRLAHRYPQIEPVRGPRLVRGLPGFISHEEGIWTLSWLEHGVAYSLDLECASPEDGRCADERQALELAEGLAYVGGSAVGAEEGTP
jgi:hypothetical protein